MSILNKKLYNTAYKTYNKKKKLKKKKKKKTEILNYCWLIEVMNTNG